MPPFSKHAFCPTAATLLAYNNNQLSGATADAVRMHLGHCDFCRAEWQMLCAHPPVVAAAPLAAPPVPLAVLCLAAQLPAQPTTRQTKRLRAA
jgi:anti-sigma factor ChrR (cupin superfamily)